jgi:hypothetical protein
MTIEQIGGAALMALFLADVFLTVLYARAGTGLLAPRWNRLVWAFVKGIARLSGRHHATVLSFAGPLIVVALIAFWALGLTLGAAFIIRPELGTAIRPSSGSTPTDLVTALMVAGNSLSIVGSGDYAPHTAGTRLLFLLNSLIGASVLSLVLSYLVQVYSALQERNALALTIDLMTAESGDAAEMLARLGPGDDFSEATGALDNLVRPLAATKEAHHFYPLLFYFRFKEPRYSVSRFSFVLLDLTALIDTALDRQKHGALLCSAPAESLRRCTMLLVETLDRNFPTANSASDAAQRQAYEASYAAACETLQRAGIDTQQDGGTYADQRSRWEPLIRRVGPTLGYGMDEIDCRRSQHRSAVRSSQERPAIAGAGSTAR